MRIFILSFLLLSLLPQLTFSQENLPNISSTATFDQAQSYLFQKGYKEKVNISSMAAREKWIEYSFVEIGDWRYTTEGSVRIYLHYQGKKYGNLLREKEEVQAEINHQVPENDPNAQQAAESQIWEAYRQLLAKLSEK